MDDCHKLHQQPQSQTQSQTQTQLLHPQTLQLQEDHNYNSNNNKKNNINNNIIKSTMCPISGRTIQIPSNFDHDAIGVNHDSMNLDSSWKTLNSYTPLETAASQEEAATTTTTTARQQEEEDDDDDDEKELKLEKLRQNRREDRLRRMMNTGDHPQPPQVIPQDTTTTKPPQQTRNTGRRHSIECENPMEQFVSLRDLRKSTGSRVGSNESYLFPQKITLKNNNNKKNKNDNNICNNKDDNDDDDRDPSSSLELRRRPSRRRTTEDDKDGPSSSNTTSNSLLRKSTLVANDSAIDVSWFASRGLMSRRSFERYKKEMKSKVLTSASSNNLRMLNPRLVDADCMVGGAGGGTMGRSMGGECREDGLGGLMGGDLINGPTINEGKHQRKSKRESMKHLTMSMPPQMHQLHNDEFETLLLDDDAAPSPPRSTSNIKSEEKKKNPFQGVKKTVASRSPSPNLSSKQHEEEQQQHQQQQQQRIDGLLQSFLSQHTGSSDATNHSTLLSTASTSNLSSDELLVLTKMVKRLSKEDVATTTTSANSTSDASNSNSASNSPIASYSKSNNSHGMTAAAAIEDGDVEYGASSPSRSMKDISSAVTIKMGVASNNNNDNNDRNNNNNEPTANNPTPNKNIANLIQKHRLRPKRHSAINPDPITPNEEKPRFGGGDRLPSIPVQTQVLLERSDTISTIGTTEEVVPAMTIKLERNDTVGTSDGINMEDSISNGLLPPSLERGDTFGTAWDNSADMSLLSTLVTKFEENIMPLQQVQRESTFESNAAVAAVPPQGRHAPEESVHIPCEVADRTVEVNIVEFPPSQTRDKNSGRPVRRFSNSTSNSSREGLSLSLRRSSNSLNSVGAALLEGPPPKEYCGDILAEGMEYLSMAMLVNIYGKLREMSMLGHASVKFVDVDVNSHQSIFRTNEMKRLGLLKPEDESKGYLENTKTAGFVVRAVLDEYEMFEASSEMCALSQANQANMAYDASLLSEFKTWVEESRTKQLDSITEGVIQKLREECSKRQMTMEERASSNSLSAMEKADVGRSVAKRRNSLIMKSDSFQGATWLKQEQALIADHFGIKNGVPKSTSECNVRRASQKISNGVLTESMIARTLEESSDYFEQGSVMRNLLEAGFEVTWFSDRHPDDITYCICVNRHTNTVNVIFRGREGFIDMCKDSSMSTYPNPIGHEDYDGNSDFIKLRSAVSYEMMRIRRDTKKSTIDEIREKVDAIGLELANGGRYHLSVTGHSKGGGLATVLGYYLASDPRLDLASAVRIFTFSSPRVGCKNFQRGFQHLEETGKLMHARFTNSNDVVSLLPMFALDDNWKFDDWYKHVGLQIRLHSSSKAGRQRTRQALDVSYSQITRITDEAVDLVMHCLAAVHSMSFGTRSSSISEYQLRLHFAREYRLALGGAVLRFDKKRKHLKSLYDYYLMKCRSVADYTDVTKRRDSMPSLLVFFFVSCLISFEVALLFRFVSTW